MTTDEANALTADAAVRSGSGVAVSSDVDATADVDLVLPCLNEAAALPGVLAAMPAGVRPIVVDNGSTDESARIAREHGATVVVEPRRGFGAACHAGLEAATAEVVAFCDADGSFDLADLAAVVRPVRAGEVDLMLGRRRATSWRSWPPHARAGNAVLAALLRRGRSRDGRLALTDIGPMRAAHRRALLDLELRDRGFGYPLEMIVRAAERGWRIAETPIGYHPRVGRSKVTGTVRGTLRAIRDMRRVLASAAAERRRLPTIVVLAKEPRPGFVKTRLTPPCTPDTAAALARAALIDTLEVVRRTPASRRVLALEGSPGPWLPEGFEVVRQVDGPLDARIAAALGQADGPVALIGMDTPQLTPDLLRLDFTRNPAWLGPASDGGFWVIALADPRPGLVEGVRMSTARTYADQRERLQSKGLRVGTLPTLRDVDTWEDACAVAELAPDTSFARLVRSL